jgi:hypothetical protein
MKSLRYLLDWVGVEPRGATAAEIAAFEKDIGFELLPEVREMFSICNGAEIVKGWMELMSLEQALELTKNLNQTEWDANFRLVPIVEDSQSNPTMICNSGYMSGYVVEFNHDFVRYRARYRKLDNLFIAMVYMVNQPKDLYWRVEHLPDDFSGYLDEYTTRANNDDHFGLKTILLANDRFKQVEEMSLNSQDDLHWSLYWEYAMPYQLGLDIIPDGHMRTIQSLLEVPEERIYEMVIDRLKRSPRGLEIILEERRSRVAFINRCADELNKAGIPTQVTLGDLPELEHENGKAGIWSNWLYARRNQPDIFQVLVEKTRELLSKG